MANSVDPDEMAHYEPSHLDLHCLQRYLCWSAGMKEVSPLYYNITVVLLCICTHLASFVVVRSIIYFVFIT